MEEGLKSLGFTDHLTGLYNRRYLYQFLPQVLEKAKSSQQNVTFCMLDLDNLKKINDTYGHLRGDKVLSELSELFKKCVRAQDFVIRYAGDEFVMVLVGVGVSMAQTLTSRIVENVSHCIFKGMTSSEQDIYVTLSGGFAIYPDDGKSLEELMEQADRALYLSKQKGKNRVHHSTEVSREILIRSKVDNSFPCPRLIDREEELSQLQRLFQASADGKLQIVFIKGAHGIGKTRLLQELKNFALGNKANIMKVRCSHQRMSQPYYVIAEAIEDYFNTRGLQDQTTVDIINKIPRIELDRLLELMPKLKEASSALPALSADESKAKDRGFILFKGIRDLFVHISRRGQILLCIDDFQWTDRNTIEFIRYLINHEKNIPVMLCAAFCEEELEKMGKDVSVMHNYIRQFSTEENFHEMTLRPLSIDEAKAMVNVIFTDTEFSADFNQTIFNTTKGNPFFIEELLKSLIDSEVIFYQDDKWRAKDIQDLNLSESLKDEVLRRMKNLDDETKEMIVRAAVIGSSFDLNSLKNIGEENEGYLLELIDRAKRLRLIEQETEKGPDKFKFITSNIQDILYEDIDKSKRQDLHKRIAEGIESQSQQDIDSVSGELAYHFDKGGDRLKRDEYINRLSHLESQLLKPEDILVYLKNLTSEIAEERIEQVEAVEIDYASFKDVASFIKSINAAVINITLYPKKSKMSVSAINASYEVLSQILKQYERLDINEFQRFLIINGKRLPDSLAKRANADAIVNMLIEHNIRTVSFLKGLEEEEFETFLRLFSQKPDTMIEQGGLKGLLKDSGINNIDVEDISFKETQEAVPSLSKDKKRLENIMLMEFLLGKTNKKEDVDTIISKLNDDPKGAASVIEEFVSGEARPVTEAIEKIAPHLEKTAHSEGEDRQSKILAKIISYLKPELRSQVLAPSQQRGLGQALTNIVGYLPEDVIIETIEMEYKKNPYSPVGLKSTIEKLLPDEEAKRKALTILSARLSELGAEPALVDFITQGDIWGETTQCQKLDMLRSLPTDIFITDDIAKELLGLLEESILKDDKESICKLMDILSRDVTKEPDAFRKKIMDIYVTLAKKVIEMRRGLGANDEARLRSCYSVFNKLFLEINNMPASKEPLSDLFTNEFINMMLFDIEDIFKGENSDIEEIFIRLGSKVVESLIDFALNEDEIRGDSFVRYLLRQKVASCLKAIGKAAIDGIKERFANTEDEKRLKNLIELSGNLGDEGLLEALKTLSVHRNANIRQQVVIAMSNIGGKQAMSLLERLEKEDKDNSIRRLAAAKLKRLLKND